MRPMLKVKSDVVGGYWGREITIARRALVKFFDNPNRVHFQNWTYGKITGEGQYVFCDVVIECPHPNGVVVQGATLRVYVPRSDKRELRIVYAWPRMRKGEEEVYRPYRPAALPLELFKLTPEYSNGFDPFDGKANWTPDV